MIDIPQQYDSVLGRLLPTLSLFGNRDVTVGGVSITKGTGRLPVKITGSFFRKFGCPGGCYVCCAILKHSNDYLIGESAWDQMVLNYKGIFERRDIHCQIGNRRVTLPLMSTLEITQPKQTAPREESVDLSKYCTFLGTIDGYGTGCKLHVSGSPLECRSAYNMRVTERDHVVQITKQGLGRAWRYDPSPECTFDEVPIDEADIESNIYILERYREWARLLDYGPADRRITALLVKLKKVLSTGDVPETIVIS